MGRLTDLVYLRVFFSPLSRAEVVINGSSLPAVVDRSNESIKHGIQPASSKWRHNQTLSLRIRYGSLPTGQEREVGGAGLAVCTMSHQTATLCYLKKPG